eukprot:Nk52_evm1s2025 gene=Nk52_evmTU1s2025
MNDLSLDLTFSEPVDMLTFDHSSVYFHESSTANASSVVIPFTVNSTNGRYMKLVTDFDAQVNFKNLVVSTFQIGKSPNDMFISWNPGLVWDMNGNGAVSGSQKAFDVFLGDTTPPVFTWIELDMNF